MKPVNTTPGAQVLTGNNSGARPERFKSTSPLKRDLGPGNINKAKANGNSQVIRKSTPENNLLAKPRV